jgi:O-antigen ligase
MAYLLALTLILTPAYAVRFNLLHLPTDVLMLWVFLFWLLFLAFLIEKKLARAFFSHIIKVKKSILIFFSLFFLSGLISLFVGGLSRANLGQFIVLFLQPLSLFFIAGFIFGQFSDSKKLLFSTAYFLLALMGIYAMLQYFTLLGLPAAWWGNSVEPKRALSFFVHPNFYALWSAPLLALLIPDLSLKVKDYGLKLANWPMIAWVLGAFGLLLSLSRSGWLGLAAAVAVYLIIGADKKIKKIIFAGIIIVLAVVVYYPNLRYRILMPFYGEKSADSRVELWEDGLKAVKQSPILGLGLTGFAQEYAAINVDPTLDTHNFPHNIFLNFWVETGLLGLISIIGLAWIYIVQGFKNRSNIYALGVCLFLIAFICQGLVDNPYFKNDLAAVFWIILSLTS